MQHPIPSGILGSCLLTAEALGEGPAQPKGWGSAPPCPRTERMDRAMGLLHTSGKTVEEVRHEHVGNVYRLSRSTLTQFAILART